MNGTSPSVRQDTLDLMAQVSRELAWIVARVPPGRELESRAPGEWTIREVLAHMVMYEERYTLPTLELMANGLPAVDLDSTGTESDLQNPAPDLAAMSATELLDRIQAAEARAAALVRAMDDEAFVTPRRSLWGPQSARWMAEKSCAHHWEHGVTVFYIACFQPPPGWRQLD